MQKLTASDGGGWFGYSVSLDGDYILVGARQGNGPVTNTGTAYVFKLIGSTWIEQQKIYASDGENDDMFGESVSIDGYYAIEIQAMGNLTMEALITTDEPMNGGLDIRNWEVNQTAKLYYESNNLEDLSNVYIEFTSSTGIWTSSKGMCGQKADCP